MVQPSAVEGFGQVEREIAKLAKACHLGDIRYTAYPAVVFAEIPLIPAEDSLALPAPTLEPVAQDAAPTASESGSSGALAAAPRPDVAAAPPAAAWPVVAEAPAAQPWPANAPRLDAALVPVTAFTAPPPPPGWVSPGWTPAPVASPVFVPTAGGGGFWAAPPPQAYAPHPYAPQPYAPQPYAPPAYSSPPAYLPHGFPPHGYLAPPYLPPPYLPPPYPAQAYAPPGYSPPAYPASAAPPQAAAVPPAAVPPAGGAPAAVMNRLRRDGPTVAGPRRFALLDETAAIVSAHEAGIDKPDTARTEPLSTPVRPARRTSPGAAAVPASGTRWP